MLGNILDYFNKGDVPNKFTIFLGEQVREARHEMHMSQRELAANSHFRQAAISDIENGKREITTAELIYLCNALNKPASYFFPNWVGNLFADNLTIDEETLLVNFRDLWEQDQKRILLIVNALHDHMYRSSFDE